MLTAYLSILGPAANGSLIPAQMRLVDLSAVDLLDYAYFLLTKDRDEKGRRKIELMLMGRIGPGGGEIIDDPSLPESMQGMEAPSWWNGDHDPWAETHRLASDTQV